MFHEIWEKNLNTYGHPSYFTGTIKINYNEFESNILSKDFKFIDNIIGNLCAGKFILIKKALTNSFINELKKNVKKFWKENPSSFYKILDDCKDFHRIIDTDIAKNYSVNAVKHATFFFPWNSDPCQIN